MLPSNEEDRRRILHASIFDAECKDSPYFEEGSAAVAEECIKYNLKIPQKEILRFCEKNFPFLPKQEFITVCVILVTLFEIDDCIDDPRRIMRVRINQLESGRSAVTSGKIEPYMSTTDCLLHHINKIKCSILQHCLKQKYLCYLDNVQNNINSEKRMMSPEEYMKYRRIDALCDYTYILMLLDVDDFRPYYYYYFHSEDGEKMRYLASETAIIHNDIASLKKDKKEGKTTNCVIVWMQSYDLTEDEAIDTLALKAKEAYEELLLMRNTVLDSIGKEVLQKLIMETSGHLIWSTQSLRYY